MVSTPMKKRIAKIISNFGIGLLSPLMSINIATSLYPASCQISFWSQIEIAAVGALLMTCLSIMRELADYAKSKSK